MTEFLSDNVRKAYPLAREWPADITGRDMLCRVLADACVCTSSEPASPAPISLLSVERSGNTLVFTVGPLGSSGLAVTINPSVGSEEFITSFASSSGIKAILVAKRSEVKSVLAKYETLSASVNTPFALRCVSYANNRVKDIRAYSAALCETPLFTGTEDPVVVIPSGVDAQVVAKDGVDAESVSVLPIEGDILRISAISAQKPAEDTDNIVDLMLRGDDCFTVDTYPGAYVEGGEIKKRTPGSSGGVLHGGVIRIGTKCKPCCQCDDYEDAFNALVPADNKAKSIKDMLDEAKTIYDKAVAAFEVIKSEAVTAINSYDNVRVSLSGVPSGGVYAKATTASGLRKRIALTLSVTNMTMQTVDATTAYSASTTKLFTVPGFSRVSLSWQTAGSSTRSGESIPDTGMTWVLKPGDTLVITGIYAKAATSNDADIPSGTNAVIGLKLPNRDKTEKRIDLK